MFLDKLINPFESLKYCGVISLDRHNHSVTKMAGCITERENLAHNNLRLLIPLRQGAAEQNRRIRNTRAFVFFIGVCKDERFNRALPVIKDRHSPWLFCFSAYTTRNRLQQTRNTDLFAIRIISYF